VSARRALADAVFALGWRLLTPLRSRRRRELLASETAPRRIVVVTPVFGIGNLVLLSGLLANLRRLYPGAYVALAVPPAEHVRSLIGEDLADEILPFDPRSRRRGLGFAWRQLRPRRFDLGLATFFLPSVHTSAMLMLAGCRYRIAFAPDEHRGLLNTFTCLDRGGHELDRHLQLLAFAGRTVERSTRVSPSVEARRWAEGTLRRPGFGEARSVVGVHPGCEPVNAQKRWPAGRFGEVIRRLVASDDVGVLLFLGPGESDLLPALDLPESRRIQVVTGESLARVIALVARCDVLLSNDSGLMHVAAGLDVPVAAIFGPTPVDKNAPVGRATILEEPGLWCRPCWVGPPLSCHRERRYCLEGVGVDEVLGATRALLASAAGAAEPRAS
jgi:heptosyltransferase-2